MATSELPLDVTPREKISLFKLRDAVKAAGFAIPKMDFYELITILRFLRANGGDNSKTMAALQETSEVSHIISIHKLFSTFNKFN